MTMLLSVMIGGAIGAVARHLIAIAVAARARAFTPWGTIIANTLGSLLLGVLVGLAASPWSEVVQIGLTTGFLGALTTFSTWMYETARLFESSMPRRALANLVGPLTLGVTAAAAGLWIGRAIAG